MRVRFLLFFIFLCIIYTASASTIGYEGWVYNNKFFTFGQDNFKVLVSSNGRSIILQSSGLTGSMNLGECLSQDYLEYCFNSSVYDTDIRDYKAYLYVYYLEPAISMTRTITQTAFSLDDTSIFHVTLENTGDADATDVVFTEGLPENAEIVSVDGGSYANNTITWSGTIEKDDSAEIEYKIRCVGKLDDYVKASVRYFDGYRTQEKFTDSVRLTSPDLYNVVMYLDDDTYEINEGMIFYINLSNNADKTMAVSSLTIAFPDSVSVTEKDGEATALGNNKYSWSGDIDELESKKLRFKLKTINTGTFFILANGFYNINYKNYPLDTEKKEFKVEDIEIGISTSLDAGDATVNSGDDYRFFVKAKNKNSFSTIKNVRLILSADIAGLENITYPQIKSNETVFLLNREIKAPIVNEDKTYPVIYNITYMGEDYKWHSVRLEKNLAVKAGKLLKLHPAFSSNDIEEGSSVDVTLSLENPGINDLKEVYVNVAVPKELILKGPVSVYTEINKSQTLRILAFSVIPGIVAEKTQYNFVFTAEYSENNRVYDINETGSISVSPKTPKVALSKSPDSSSAFMGEPLKITYTLANEDLVPINDITVYTTESRYFDTIGLFSHKIPKLDPGESIVINGEQIRPKYRGNIDTGSSIAFFRDSYGRIFNKSSSGASVEVKEAQLSGPAIIVGKAVSDSSPSVSEDITVTINVTNIGTETVTGRLDDKEQVTIQPRNTKTYEKKIKILKEGNYIIPRSVFYYTYMDKETRAYSDETVINAVNATEPLKVTETQPENQETAKPTEVLAENTPEKKVGIFGRIFNWFKRLFVKNP